MISRWIILAVVASVFLPGCADVDTGWTGTISDSAGVTIVSNPEQGIWAPGEEWIVEEEVRIGAVEGDPNYVFGEIMGVAVDSRGRIFVLDYQAQHIQVYSADGVYEQTVGGPGEGPGELRAAAALFMGPGDTLLVPDYRTYRFNRYASDGASVPGFSMALQERRPRLWKATPSGLMVEQFETRTNVPEGPKEFIGRLAPDGTILDTLLTFNPYVVLGPEGRPIRVRIYAPEMIWDLSDELELIGGMNDDYRIKTYSGGKIQRVITKPFHPVPVENEEKERIEARFRSLMRESGVSPERLEGMWAGTHIADSYPAFQGLFWGPSGTVWVQQSKRVSELLDLDFWARINLGQIKGAKEWDVFDSEGRFLGVVSMPDRFRAWLFQGDKIYGTWYDEYDVPYVVRLGLKDPTGT